MKYDQEPTRYRVAVLTSSGHSVDTQPGEHSNTNQIMTQRDRLKYDEEPTRYRVAVLTS